MSYVINTAVTDTFILRDNSNVALTGKVIGDFATFEAYSIVAPGTTATVTITEVGSGEYSISFTPTTATTWTAHAVYNSGGVFREFSETYDVLTVQTTTVVVSTATVGALTQTLAQLRKRVAERLGDYDELTATSNGLVSTFIDALNINSATEDMKGRIVVLSGGTVHRVSAMVDSTNTITIVPSAGSTSLTATGQVASVYNKRGKGFSPAQYRSAINNAINDAFPLGRIETRSTISGDFDADTPEITVPASMTHVHTVEWSDDEGDWHVLMKATRSNEQGWRADPAAGQIRLQGIAASQADGYSVRVTGYGRQDVLTADSDTCALNAEYVIARACYHLTYGNIDRDEKYAQTTTGYEKEAKALRMRLRRIERTDSELVRSI